MEIEKDNFEDDNELSRLEDDEELAGETEEIVETEEEELVIVGEEPEEETPAPKPAAKPAGKKPAKKAAKKKPAKKKKAAKSKPKRKRRSRRRRKRGGRSFSGSGELVEEEAGTIVPAFSFCGITPPGLGLSLPLLVSHIEYCVFQTNCLERGWRRHALDCPRSRWRCRRLGGVGPADPGIGRGAATRAPR